MDIGTTVHRLDLSVIRAAVSEASVIPTSQLYFVIEYLHAWAGATGDVDMALTDITYGVQMVDSGSYSTRARVGIRYPKNVQKTYYPGETSIDLFELGASTDVKCDFRIGVTCWGLTG